MEGPLGIEDGSIANNQITASSQWNSDYPGWKGRLNSANEFWSKGNNDDTPWIQVAFTSEVIITAIQTQGADDEGSDGKVWVKELHIQTGNSVDSLSYIMDGPSPKVSYTDIILQSYYQFNGRRYCEY